MSNTNTSKEIKEKAKAAANKPATFGEDVDLSNYSTLTKNYAMKKTRHVWRRKLKIRC